MYVKAPITISDFTSNISEPDTGETEWSAGTSTVGNIRILTSTHRKYRAAVASTDSPDVGVLKDPKTWVDIGPTNKWAWADNRNSTQSIATGGVEVEVNLGIVAPSLSGFNITGASSIEIVVSLASDGVIATRSIPMIDNSEINDYFPWFFSEIANRTEFIVTDLPFYGGATINVEAVGTGDVGVGSLVFGTPFQLGAINYGTSYKLLAGGVEDDSATMKLIDYKFTIWTNQGGSTYRKLESLLGKPAVYFATENVDNGAMVLGFYVDSNISIDTPAFSPVALSVKGVN